MKKYISILLTIFLIPIFVNAETLTYEVCESGCEYTSFSDVNTEIRNISDLTDKDIVINVNSDNTSGYGLNIGDSDNVANSVTINGNNHDFNNNRYLNLYSKQIEISDCNNLRELDGINFEIITVKNSNIKMIAYMSIDSENHIKSNEINLSNILDIDEASKDNLKIFGLGGNIKIENIDFSNQVIYLVGGTINIYNSRLNKVFNVPEEDNIITNIYNSKFNSLKYVNITSSEDAAFNEFVQFMRSDSPNSSLLNYDIYDIDGQEFGEQIKSTTTVYFDKETKLKPGDKLNLVEFLDYYTEDKEIEYTIEDESIAKIENKELIGLKEGSTKVSVTTDEGHIIYRINLVVEKESIPEKIDKMTIKVPITGSKLKLWVLIVGAILLGIVGICTSMLIKRKK